MIKKVITAFNCLIINNIKFALIKLFHIKKFYYNFINYISPLTKIDIQGNGILRIEKKCNIYSNVKLGVRECGNLIIKEGTFINNNCQIIAHKNITIGKNVSFGPNVMVYDHDHAYNKSGIIKGKYNCEDVSIGNNVWIGANCIILKGTKIGDNSVIAAGSVVKGEVPSNVIFIQKKKTTFLKNGDENEK